MKPENVQLLQLIIAVENVIAARLVLWKIKAVSSNLHFLYDQNKIL